MSSFGLLPGHGSPRQRTETPPFGSAEERLQGTEKRKPSPVVVAAGDSEFAEARVTPKMFSQGGGDTRDSELTQKQLQL